MGQMGVSEGGVRPCRVFNSNRILYCNEIVEDCTHRKGKNFRSLVESGEVNWR